ncbi:hypothetical protein [Peribacillus asahii]|uniref:hypothetical protein n=1 Tax=Peribacillus asahii TaxID=228899 RepID=UPI002079E9EF|nr:hypothetical protein [Peribacillus asahii]USK70894.1 hypothetical protein LIS76_03765 [Peribacillus asahii]
MTDKEKELTEQILDKVKSIHNNLTEFRYEIKDFMSETRTQFNNINKRLDKMIERNEETRQSLERISKNLER